MKTIEKAKVTISRITSGDPVAVVRSEIANNKEDWFRISSKAYSLHLQTARTQRKEDTKKRNISTTSNNEISDILELNNNLSTYAICLPTRATQSDLKKAMALLPEMPSTETKMLYLIENITLEPKIRAQQNIGRIRQFDNFKEFAHLVEAATLCYFRGNYASSYLTLVPVIEGIILRWSGYQGLGKKPAFDEIRKFFRTFYIRQPCPANPLFHDIYCKACDKIINEHLYRPSHNGTAYAEFNRHQASHLLRDTTFANRENCIRLFLLLDTMAQIYNYESRCSDPMFYLTGKDIIREVTFYTSILLQTEMGNTPESTLL